MKLTRRQKPGQNLTIGAEKSFGMETKEARIYTVKLIDSLWVHGLWVVRLKKLEMQYRNLGRTEIQVSEIGFGAWGIGGVTPGATSYGHRDDSVSLAALGAAIDHGINFFDTSNCYGNGHSESLIGRVTRANRAQFIIATKAGRRDYATEAFEGPALKSSLESSLTRLQTEYVDLLQLHGPSMRSLEKDPELIATLNSLQAEKKIRAFGISVNSPEDGLTAITKFDFPVVQMNFNLVDQRARVCGLLKLAKERGVGLIGRTPLCFGFLSGRVNSDTQFDQSDHRLR